MSKTISEQALETAIVADLTKATYIQRPPSAFDKALCLDAGPLIDFVQATQPKEWAKFYQQHKEDAKPAFLKRVAAAIEADGTVTVLRQGVKATGCKFRLAFWKPETTFNPDTEVLYQANQFTVMRQVRYSEKTDHSLDLVLFLNGLPLFTAELKNPLNNQDVTDAITQYRRTRDPREPVFALGRCLAHFAVDPSLVYVATHLKGDETLFLPFNRGDGEGKERGAGNSPPKLGSGFSTDYLWREVWARDSILDLVQYFVQDVRDRDDQGKLKRSVIFPRYHQLESVRRLVAHARAQGPGENYLIQHSAGSGKANAIAWLAHRLVSLHDKDDKRVFDSVIVVTDRVALDRQLSRTVSSFEQTAGLVEHIDEGGKHLKQALEAGKQIIITTLQKFPVVLEEIRKLGQDKLSWKAEGLRFALILDEAHSSQGGDAAKEMKSTLRVGSDDEEGSSPTDLALKETFVTRKISRGVAAIHHGFQKTLYMGNIDSLRDWGDARDYVKGMHLILQQDIPDDYVLATGEMHTVREFIERAFAETGRKITWRGGGTEEEGVDDKTGNVLVKIDPRYFRPTEVDLLLGDPSKARKVLGWKHEITFPNLVREMVASDLKVVLAEGQRNS